MFVIKSKTWIEDHYEVEDLYEEIVYSKFETAFNRLIEISQTEEYAFFINGNEPLVIIRGYFQRQEERLEFLECESTYWITIKKLDVK